MKIQKTLMAKMPWLSNFILILLLLTAAFTISSVLRAPTSEALSTQLGVQQVTLNSGGGLLSNGSDGLRFTINSDASSGSPNYNRARSGQDGVVHRGTYQYCCSAGGPLLNIGGSLYGQAGPASGNESAWNSIEIVSTSGATTVGPRTNATGNSSATVKYTINHNGLTYVINRTVSYVYPNDFVTDSYSFVIPTGNTEEVKFYLGGDTAPGSSDSGYGIMLTSPVRSIISLNTHSQIMFGFREVQGSRPFDGATSQDYYTPYGTVVSGDDIGFTEVASEHDAGLMMQWNLGSTPGTYTGAFEQFAAQQGTNLTAAFAKNQADVSESVNLNLSIVNSELEAAESLGYTITLPSGLEVSGSVTSSCGGSLDTESSSYITLSGATVAGASNCVLTIPVSAESAGAYSITSSNISNVTGPLTTSIGNSTLNVGVYTLTFATQGGDPINEVVSEETGSITVPTPTRNGYTLVEWNTQADGEGDSYQPGDSFVMPNENITLYALWQHIPYSITFDEQGGTNIEDLEDLAAGTQINLPQTTRTGYELLEWNTQADGEGNSYNAGAAFTIPAGNTSLYAIWVKVHTITFVSQGADPVSPITGQGGDFAWLPFAPSGSNSQFIGWNTEANGTGTTYEEGDVFVIPDNDITLYATWQDDDGVTDEIENNAPNNGDGNNDGIPDSQQANVASLVSPISNEYVSLVVDEECDLSEVSISNESGHVSQDQQYQYNSGFVNFTATGCAEVEVNIYFHNISSENLVVRKYNTNTNEYFNISQATLIPLSAPLAGTKATYTITDNGSLDMDPANNVITDPVGLGSVLAASPGSPAADPSGGTLTPGAPNTGIETQSMTSYLVTTFAGVAALMTATIFTLRNKLHEAVSKNN